MLIVIGADGGIVISDVCVNIEMPILVCMDGGLVISLIAFRIWHYLTIFAQVFPNITIVFRDGLGRHVVNS